MQNIYIIELNWIALRCVQERLFCPGCVGLRVLHSRASFFRLSLWSQQQQQQRSRGASCCPAESGESPSASSGSSTTSIIHFHWSSHIASFSARTLRSAGMPPSSNGGRDSLGSACAGGHRPRAVFGAWLGWRHEETNKNLIIAG